MGLYVHEKGCSSLLQYNKYYIDNIGNLYRNTIYIIPSVDSYLGISNLITHKTKWSKYNSSTWGLTRQSNWWRGCLGELRSHNFTHPFKMNTSNIKTMKRRHVHTCIHVPPWLEFYGCACMCNIGRCLSAVQGFPEMNLLNPWLTPRIFKLVFNQKGG